MVGFELKNVENDDSLVPCPCPTSPYYLDHHMVFGSDPHPPTFVFAEKISSDAQRSHFLPQVKPWRAKDHPWARGIVVYNPSQ